MSDRAADRRLRMQMLRLRGELQRADAVAALTEVRESGHRIGRVFGAVASLRGLSAAGAGWAAPLLVALRERPWLLALALSVVRTAKRHPAAVAVAGAVLVVARLWARPPAAKAPSEPARSWPEAQP